jgi:hypothetical protein
MTDEDKLAQLRSDQLAIANHVPLLRPPGAVSFCAANNQRDRRQIGRVFATAPTNFPPPQKRGNHDITK